MSSLLHDLVSPAVVRALGWTLLHALWQGALVALLLRGGLLAARRGAAATRYTLSAGALLLLLGLAISTFVQTYEPPRFHLVAPVTVMTLRDAPVALPAAFDAAPEVAAAIPDWRDRLELTVRTIAARLEPWLPVLVAVWALGLALMLARLGGGLLVVQRLRRVGVGAVPARWQESATTLAQLMGIDRAVALLESASVNGPVAVGWLRPVILLPIGLLDGLPVAQLEAVLAHELAHIRRHDYLLNLLQSVIEAIFFFHPAVWWMSAQVRREREHCCDDLAVAALGGDARPLARALAALAAWQPAPVVAPALPRLSLAATGGALLTRVRRLLVPTAEEATRPAGALAGGGAAALALLLVLTISALLRAPLPAQAAAQLPKMVREVLPLAPADPPLPPLPPDPEQPPTLGVEPAVCTLTDTTKATAKRQPNLIIVKDRKDRLREVYVDGKKVPKDRLDEYAPLVDEALKAPADHPRTEVASETDLAEARRALKDAQKEARRAGKKGGSHQITLSDDVIILDGKVLRTDSLNRHLEAQIGRAFENLDLSNFELAISDDMLRFQTYGAAPVAPVPPVPPVPPVAPMPPAPRAPKAPKAPKAGDAKAQRKYQQQLEVYGKQMEEYGRQMEAYGHQLEAFQQQCDGRGAAADRAPRYRKGQSRGYTYRNGDEFRISADARREAARDRAEALRDAEEARREAAEARREALRDAEEARRDAAEARRGPRYRTWNYPTPPTPPAPPAPPHFESGRIGDELRKDGLIGKDARRYSLSYEDGELRINGKEQSAEVKEKYRKLLDIPTNDEGTSLQIEINED